MTLESMNITSYKLKILIYGKDEPALSQLSHLPTNAEITTLPSVANVLLLVNNCGNDIMSPLIESMPQLIWIHSLSAGIDALTTCTALQTNKTIIVTNAKGVYSSSLAEYVMMACSYFAKDIPRWIKNKEERKWDNFMVGELKRSTMGIIGYGDIGSKCAHLAKAYGMTVIGLRRRPELSLNDPLLDKVYGLESISEVMRVSDYLVISAALTPATRNLINTTELSLSKPGQVLINIGRGPIVNEEAMIYALQYGQLRGAALDVYTTEPLPSTSPLYDLPNVLLSSHNADNTLYNRIDSVQCFIDNCISVLKVGGLSDLKNIVDPRVAGY